MTTTAPAQKNPLRTILLVVGSIALVAVIGYVIIAVVSNANRTDASREIEFSETFDEVTIDTEVADVVVEYAEVEEASVDFQQNGSRRTFEFDAEVVGSTLEVRVVDRWDGIWIPFGSVTSPRLVVTLPEELAGVDLDVETGVGDVRIDGEFGDIVFASGVGDLRLEGSAARADLESGVGDITTRGFRVEGDVVVESGTGDVTLDLARVPEALRVNSGVGDQEITLPDGEYRIDTTTGVGDISVLVDSDPDASSVFRFESGVGDITISR